MSSERKIQDFSCINHNKSELKIDNLTLQLYCLKCKTNDPKSYLIINHQQPENINSLKMEYCNAHLHVYAEFYCEDCKLAICEECFLLHKQHNCYTPDILSSKYINELNELKEKLLLIKQTSEANLDNLKPVQDFYKTMRSSIESIINQSNSNIDKALNNKETIFDQESSKIFKGFDLEIAEAILFLNNLKENLISSSTKLLDISKSIESLSSDVEICLFKKKNYKDLLEIDNLINNTETYINDKVIKIKFKAEKNIPIYEEECRAFIQKILKYQSLLVSSLNSGISSTCYRIRRYKQYFSYEIAKYFRHSSLCLMVNKSITLSGLGLCGLFIDNLYKKREPLALEIKIIESNFYIPLQSRVSLTNQENRKELLNMKINLPSIKNIIDPVYQFYFNRSITLSKDKVYYITINNESKEDLIKIWSGSIEEDISENDYKEENLNQTIVCNDTLVKFIFLSAFGFESDYNEFTMGIISDLIYSYAG